VELCQERCLLLVSSGVDRRTFWMPIIEAVSCFLQIHLTANEDLSRAWMNAACEHWELHWKQGWYRNRGSYFCGSLIGSKEGRLLVDGCQQKVVLGRNGDTSKMSFEAEPLQKWSKPILLDAAGRELIKDRKVICRISVSSCRNIPNWLLFDSWECVLSTD